MSEWDFLEWVTVGPDNLDREHICCAITDKKGETGVRSKKAWMEERFADGLVFLRLNARGKAFIEYIPAEHAWCPLSADGFLHINCFWVSGRFQGHGIAGRLLEQCIKDAKAKGKLGLTVVASEKKRPFLSDPGYLKRRGFLAVDTAPPYFVLYCLPFTADAPTPQFKECVKHKAAVEPGMVLYYSSQCPHTDKYAPLIRDLAQKRGASVSLHKIETEREARNAPSPFPTYSFFCDGEFVTHEIFSEKKFEQFLDSRGF